MNNWHIKIAQCNEAQKEVLRRVYGNQVVSGDYIGKDSEGGLVFYDVSELITPEEAFKRLELSADINVDAGLFQAQMDKYQLLSRMLSCSQTDLRKAEQKIKELEEQLEIHRKEVRRSKSLQIKLSAGRERVKELEQENAELNQQGELVAHELHESEEGVKKLTIALSAARDEVEGYKEAARKVSEYCGRLEQQLVAKPELLGVDWSQAPDGTTGIGQCNNLLSWVKGDKFWVVEDGVWSEQISGLWQILATRPKPKYSDSEKKAVKDFYRRATEVHAKGGSYSYDKWLKEVGNE